MQIDPDAIVVLQGARNAVCQRCERCGSPVITKTGLHYHFAGHQTSVTQRDGKTWLQGQCGNRACQRTYRVDMGLLLPPAAPELGTPLVPTS